MHIITDTDEADSRSEQYWPEKYKLVLRRTVFVVVRDALRENVSFQNLRVKNYSDIFLSFDEFTRRIAETVIVGAENGADDAFGEIYMAFSIEGPLPVPRSYAQYLWPKALTREAEKEVRATIIGDYSKERLYQHEYLHYQEQYPDFDSFISCVAESVVIGAANGADDMLAKIYGSLLSGESLPTARRYPKRLQL